MPEGAVGSQLEETQLQTTHSKGNPNLSLPSHTLHHPVVTHQPVNCLSFLGIPVVKKKQPNPKAFFQLLVWGNLKKNTEKLKTAFENHVFIYRRPECFCAITSMFIEKGCILTNYDVLYYFNKLKSFHLLWRLKYHQLRRQLKWNTVISLHCKYTGNPATSSSRYSWTTTSSQMTYFPCFLCEILQAEIYR